MSKANLVMFMFRRIPQEDSIMLRRFFLQIVVLSVALLSVIGVAQARTLNDIIESKTLRVGVNPNFPPMSSYGSTNQFEGFDIDVGNMLAAALGVEAEFVPTETPQRVPFLVSDKIDISLGALTRTPARSLLISYTAPLHTEAMAVLTTDKLDITQWKDLNDSKYTLANMRGNWTVGWTKDNLPNAKLELVDTIADTVRLVGQGRADAIVENIDFFMAHTSNYPDVNWRVLSDTIFVAYCAIGVGQGNFALRDTLNIVLHGLHSSNTINATWEKWYGAPMLAPVVETPFF